MQVKLNIWQINDFNQYYLLIDNIDQSNSELSDIDKKILEAEGKDAKRHRTSIKYMKKFLEYLHERDDLEVTVLTGADGLAIIRFINEQ